MLLSLSKLCTVDLRSDTGKTTAMALLPKWLGCCPANHGQQKCHLRFCINVFPTGVVLCEADVLSQ